MEKVEIYASDDITLGYLSMNSSDEHWSDDQSSIVENDLLYQPYRVQLRHHIYIFILKYVSYEYITELIRDSHSCYKALRPTSYKTFYTAE